MKNIRLKNENAAEAAAERADKTESAGDGGVRTAGKPSVYCLSVIGQIEGHYALDATQKATKYEHLIPLLCGIEESPEVDGLLLLLNTMGGDVEAGLALSELIASMSKPTVTLVLGGGHSIGVPLAVSGAHSFIVPSATMTLHPVRSSGTVIGVPQSFYYFDKMQDRIVNFICGHSKISEQKLRALMNNTAELANDVGSIVDGREAVVFGLIDEVGGLSDALAALKKLIAARQ